jgi:hypothetical protein
MSFNARHLNEMGKITIIKDSIDRNKIDVGQQIVSRGAFDRQCGTKITVADKVRELSVKGYSRRHIATLQVLAKEAGVRQVIILCNHIGN